MIPMIFLEVLLFATCWIVVYLGYKLYDELKRQWDLQQALMVIRETMPQCVSEIAEPNRHHLPGSVILLFDEHTEVYLWQGFRVKSEVMCHIIDVEYRGSTFTIILEGETIVWPRNTRNHDTAYRELASLVRAHVEKYSSVIPMPRSA